MRLSLFWGVVALSVLPLSKAVAAEAPACPEGTPTVEVLEAWRLTTATGLNDGSLTGNKVAERIKQCFTTQVPVCLKRTLDYSTRNDLASASADATIETSPQKRPPDELLVPGATGLAYHIPENIEQLAAEKGWPAVRYKSRHSGGFDSETPSLLMVYVPGDKVNPPVEFDRWLNFALPADSGPDELTPLPQAAVPGPLDYAAELSGGKSLPSTFTMVTLDRKVGPQPSKVYFQMFNRGDTGSPVFMPQSNSSVSGCISCHPNGLRAISPLGYHVRAGEAQLPEADWKAVELINSAMDAAAGNKSVSWRDVVVDQATGATKPLLTPKSQGPTVGPTKPLSGPNSRTKEFIMGGTLPDGTTVSGCFNRRTTISVTDIFGRAPGANNIYKLSAEPQINWETVKDNMKCASCHNDNSRGAITRQTSWSQIDFKILVDQSMPLGAHANPLEQGSTEAPVVDELTPDERIALTNCLQAEYELEQKQLVKWLTQTACQ